MKRLHIILSLLVVIGIIIFAGIYFYTNTEDIVIETDFIPMENSISESAEEKNMKLSNTLEAAFIPGDCPAGRSASSLPDNYYRGPLIDTHIHIAAIPDGNFNEMLDENDPPVMGANINMNDYVCMMSVEDTTQVFAFFSVWEPIIDEQLLFVNETMRRYPDKFVPFIMPPDHDDRPNGFPTVNSRELSMMLTQYRGMFAGYGEIGLYKRNAGAPALLPDSQRMLEIYPVVREHNLIVYVHLGEGQQQAFEHALKQHPDITFIWHGDQLIPTENNKQDLQFVAEILERYPNAYYGVDELYGGVWLIKPEVSKEEFLEHFKNPEALLEKDLRDWKYFIETHSDQVLWGTDRGWSSPWSVDSDVALTLNNYSRAFLGRLDGPAAEKIAYKNAEKILKKNEE